MVDYFQILGFVVIVFGFAYGFTYLLRKKVIDKNDVIKSVDITKTVIISCGAFLANSKFDNDKVKVIIGLIGETLDYINVLSGDLGKDEKIKNGMELVRELCVEDGISLTDDEFNAIESVLIMGYDLYLSLSSKV